jgi:hypothetical protein
MDDARIVYVYADNANDKFYCSNWLCGFPYHALDRAGYNVDMIPIDQFVHRDHDADLYIVERLLWNGADSVISDGLPDGPLARKIARLAGLHVLDKIEKLQQKGRKVAALFDDHYEAYPRDTEVPEGAALWLDGTIDGTYIGFVPIEHFREGLNLVDAILSPSRYLLDYYAGHKMYKTYHVRNRPILDMWENLHYNIMEEPVRIGWSGTSQHIVSWRGNDILDALEELKDRIVIVGATATVELEGLFADRGIEFRNRGVVPFSQFPSVVAGYDIGICPLKTEYDKGRSWIKWLESSLAGVPVVGQDLEGVYGECDGGFRTDSADGWYTALTWLMDDPTIYAVESHEGRAWAWAQGWDENLPELTTIFDEILND